MTKTFEELVQAINAWGIARDIVFADKQIDKLRSEVEELNLALQSGHQDDEIDAVGDIQVVLINYCRTRGLDPVSCLSRAYDTIKSRKGITIAGYFVKDADIQFGNKNFDVAWMAFFADRDIQWTIETPYTEIERIHFKRLICFKNTLGLEFDMTKDATKAILNAIKHYS